MGCKSSIPIQPTTSIKSGHNFFSRDMRGIITRGAPLSLSPSRSASFSTHCPPFFFFSGHSQVRSCWIKPQISLRITLCGLVELIFSSRYVETSFHAGAWLILSYPRRCCVDLKILHSFCRRTLFWEALLGSSTLPGLRHAAALLEQMRVQYHWETD